MDITGAGWQLFCEVKRDHYEFNVLKGLDFAKYRPAYLLVGARSRQEVDDFLASNYQVVADGPRSPEEAERCAQTRKIIDQVDWECRVETNFSKQNLGLKVRMSSGLDWVFSQVKEAIILEDEYLEFLVISVIAYQAGKFIFKRSKTAFADVL